MQWSVNQIIKSWSTPLKSVNPLIKSWSTEPSGVRHFDCVVSQSLFNLIPLFDLVEISWNWNYGLDSKLIWPNSNSDIQGTVILCEMKQLSKCIRWEDTWQLQNIQTLKIKKFVAILFFITCTAMILLSSSFTVMVAYQSTLAVAERGEWWLYHRPT